LRAAPTGAKRFERRRLVVDGASAECASCSTCMGRTCVVYTRVLRLRLPKSGKKCRI
jgi:hypothetical protein